MVKKWKNHYQKMKLFKFKNSHIVSVTAKVVLFKFWTNFIYKMLKTVKRAKKMKKVLPKDENFEIWKHRSLWALHIVFLLKCRTIFRYKILII